MPSEKTPVLSSRQVSWLEFERAPHNVLAGVSTRWGGRSSGVYAANNLALHVGDEPDPVQRNRAALQTTLDATHVQWLEQVHGTQCIQATGAAVRQVPQADAVWCDEPGLALAIMTADCVPVLMWDDNGSVVGAAHAGWRGMVNGVLEHLVAALRNPAPQARFNAWIGPCISTQYYEVGEDVWQHFVGLQTEGGAAVVQAHPQVEAMAQGKRLLDLAAAAQLRLRQAGVGAVYQSGLCSYADERFYSHRQAQHQAVGEHTGRMASVIMLRQL